MTKKIKVENINFVFYISTVKHCSGIKYYICLKKFMHSHYHQYLPLR